MTRPAIAFLWHMHQPLYRLRGERACFMPWVRLHAIRSYYDMVRVLEEFPAVRVTINVVPVLLDQIRAYGEGGSDLFLDTGAVPAEDLDEAQRIFLFDHFFSAQPERMIGELPRYTDLLSRRDQARRIRGPAE
ncbi:MAG TPA: glycoside hydrolase family 57, partial [Candidatus Polarisedimenticolia bacterium]|nr:glycoside hydrolase family 57 [Candidatus Polarisedimenticolia bacterium]